MPVPVHISLAEMTPVSSEGFPRILYRTQRLTLLPNRLGGLDETYNQDHGILTRGRQAFRGSNSLGSGDRASVRDSAYIESLLVRMMQGGTAFACPIKRPNDESLWSFSGTRAARSVDLDSDLFEDYLNITVKGSAIGTGYTVGVVPVLKRTDATLSDLRVSVAPGALCSVGGKLFMVTRAADRATTLSGLWPGRSLDELAVSARLLWREPWMAARLLATSAVTLEREGSMAGPWSYDFEEVG